MKRTLFIFILFFLSALSLYAQEKVEVFPTTPYDRFIIYETLAIFWLGIVGLVIIIKIKLREIERIQKMGIDGKEKEIPLLD
jgi:TRAP-type C4-dicarboxylate transport system permease small subunit